MSMTTSLTMDVGSHEVVLDDNLSEVNGSAEYVCTNCGTAASNRNDLKRFNCE